MIYKIADNVLSPLGNTTSENYQAVKSGRSAIQRHEGFWRLKEPFSSAFFPKEAIAHLCTEGMTPGSVFNPEGLRTDGVRCHQEKRCPDTQYNKRQH